MHFRLKKGSVLTMRKFNSDFLFPENFRQLEWFRPPNLSRTYRDSSNEDSYGPHLGIYTLNRNVRLLNLGNADVRAAILKHTNLTEDDFNPDNQYSGCIPNRKVQLAILNTSHFKRFDGTIITDILIDDELYRNLAGPDEVVLFTKRTTDIVTCIHPQIVFIGIEIPVSE